MSATRAIGLIRVSQRDEDAKSPAVQRRALRRMAKEHGWLLAPDDLLDENIDNGKVHNVSGGAVLEGRPKLAHAVAEIESGHAQVLAAEHFDRLFRSVDVQREVIRRVEAAGGQVWRAAGRISMQRAAEKAMATMEGTFAEYVKDAATERSVAAVDEAIAEGKVPWNGCPPGYTRTDGKLTPDKKTAKVVVKAFRMRAGGATIEAVRDYLADNGIVRSYHGVESLLKDRLLIGEIHFGERTNLAAHPAIIDRALFDRVQRVSVPRGRPAKSDRLLARLGILRCGSCGGRMVVGTQRQNGRSYPFYRCSGKGSPTSKRPDCAKRQTIGAEIVERLVVDAVRDAIADEQGRASAEQGIREAEAALEAAQAELDSALRAFDAAGLASEQAAVDRLRELREVRDAARARVDRLGDRRASVVITAGADWGRLSLEGRRALVRAVVESVVIHPGRGEERVDIRLVTEN